MFNKNFRNTRIKNKYFYLNSLYLLINLKYKFKDIIKNCIFNTKK